MNKKHPNKPVLYGNININASGNNVIILLANLDGNTRVWSSSGSCGFQGARRGSPVAGKLAMEGILKGALELGIKEVIVTVKGSGPIRDAALRSLRKASLKIVLIRDITPISHNGCRLRKKRRI